MKRTVLTKWGSLVVVSALFFMTGCENASDDDGANAGIDPGAVIDASGNIGDPAFTLVWSYDIAGEGPDIDFYVTDPNGATLSTSRNGYGLGPTPEGGIIDFDDRGAEGDGDGGGPERAYWPQGQAPQGVYSFGVRYYSGTGHANYTMRVYKGGRLVATKTGTLTERGGTIELGSISSN
ncbi:MAG: hypothetical protein JXN60_03985 [Lentisphaerae bacterium]|nr:hypothetical protein [Lentisphaerota bacterium]